MAPSAAEADSAAFSSGRLLVLYASQTGNAMDAAERVGREAERGGCTAVDVLSMDGFDPSRLPSERFVVFVVSTTGQGDPPDSMKGFWRYLLRKDLGAQWLEGVRHAVFGLGDSGYQKYNFAAKKLDRRLSHLGAEQVIEIGLGDDQHPSGARTMSPALQFHDDGGPPYMLQMVANQRLTEEGSDRHVRHFELEDPSSAVSYKTGDALEILPSQNPSAVDAFIERCNLDPDCYVTIRGKSEDKISNGSAVMSFFATAEHEKEKLQYFSSPEGRDDLYQYNQKESRTVLEVLEDFPSVQMPFEWLVQLTPPLKKRAFSISSSPLAHPNQIHLTVSIVSWLTPFKRTRHGLCSTWLAGLDPRKDNLIPCWIRQGSLPPPHPSVPLVLIGPGTVCAPFRAFVEERAAQSVAEPTAPVLYFFGCRNQDNDFLYKDFWLAHAQDEGVLSSKKDGGLFVAFSRDQPQKVYVQHKIKEQSARVWNLLLSGAAVYIAGSSTKMPADVTAALEEVICKEQGVKKEDASKWLRALERAGRFNIETWS
ncbi:NADPH-dependent diflavin oxidoreductase 1 isoform X2 [Panicum miliaceum]|uniref:NADPH-dependent diflavin oxidoreductase 1 isoform X2 n=1 Tax=Panicum miliaceum TaxID=4540 RepID=A0A3L6QGN7_PANMI|nr:NADPH-dependent diflavin oxidoreductase 1 isoform X2 [Panicum miliaceum]